MYNWNDLRHLIAVAEHGSTIAAAKAQGVSQSTVQRRLAALEAALGRSLAVRAPEGYVLTLFGTALLPHAKEVEGAARLLAQRAADGGSGDAFTIRLTCPEPVVTRLMPLIERFQASHPAIRIALVTSDRYVDIRQGEADVAFRSGDTDADLFGRKVADSVWAVYASPDYIARCGAPAAPAELADHRIVALDDSMADHRVNTWPAPRRAQGAGCGAGQQRARPVPVRALGHRRGRAARKSG